MNLSLQSYAKLLKIHKVPHYAYPKFEPSEIFDHYKFSTMVGTRQISTEHSTKFTRRTESYRVDKVTQQRIWQKLIKPKTEVYPYVVAISSSVNDYLAHEVASTLVLSIIRNYKTNIQWEWVTPKFDPYKSAMTTKPNVVVIRNVMPIRERLYNIRDILDFYQNSLRILVVGGVDGLDFFDNFLYYPLNGAIHVAGYKGKIPKEYWVKDDHDTVLDNDEFKVPVFLVDKFGKTIMQNFKATSEEE